MKNPKRAARRGVSRRDFFKNAGAGLLASELAATTAAARAAVSTGPAVLFTPSGGLTQISPNLYVLRDTCNVYVLKDGNRALLIDFGSGHVLKLLGQAGVTQVDAILHTHHHRDQCQGDGRAAAERIPIHVPGHERHLFEDAENFWRNRRVFHLYYVRNDFFTITHNLPVAGILRDYDTFRWGPHELLIYPTPGHTLGSVSLVGTIDGRKTAFTGDLIHSPGKVVNLYDLQYQYGSTDGVDFAVYSLARMRELGPELICPSHGEPFRSAEAGYTELMGKMRSWAESYAPGTSFTVDNHAFAVTPHLVASHQTTSSFYAVISDSGKALFVDYGSASGNFFNGFNTAAPVLDRMRFVEHTIPELKARYGMKSIDVAMPSHMHDDHLNGFPHLARHHGAKIWCYDNMVDILENPRGHNLGCTLAEPIKVDRAFRNGETFKWEEFEFKIFHSPGHTEYQMAMFADIDGARVAFTGDAIFPATAGAPYQLRHNLIFRNWVENDSHLRSMRTILDHAPNIIAPGHGKPFVANQEDLQDLKRRLEQQQRYFSDVIADPDSNFGLNPSWARLYPYQLLAKVGSTATLELRVRNYRAKPMHLEAALVLPEDWKAAPEVTRLDVPAQSDGKADFAVTIPEAWDHAKPRVAVAADILADGQYLGQIAEGVVDIEFKA
ncbi:MAG: MBL fold metallo-hydrolase [Terriglobia bacterium]|jgi:glyoxylase-like metal-dependent hydrolase (beta-lactamase superfamily II)